MLRLAEAASVRPHDSSFARLAYADRLAGFFTTNAILHLEGLNAEFPSVTSPMELREAATAARAQLRQAEFKLADLTVSVAGDHRAATAYVVISGRINSRTNDFGQAFNMSLRKIHGRWLISDVNAIQHVE